MSIITTTGSVALFTFKILAKIANFVVSYAHVNNISLVIANTCASTLGCL